MNSTPKKVPCLRCRHYMVTWDMRHPHGCKAMGFKTKELPSDVVYKSSGMQCQHFSPKPRKQPAPNRTA